MAQGVLNVGSFKVIYVKQQLGLFGLYKHNFKKLLLFLSLGSLGPLQSGPQPFLYIEFSPPSGRQTAPLCTIAHAKRGKCHPDHPAALPDSEFQSLYEFPAFAVTNYHNFSSLKHHKLIILQSRRAEVL